MRVTVDASDGQRWVVRRRWLVLLLGEQLLRAIVLPVTLVADLAFRRPWTSEATTEWETPVRRKVVEWSESRDAVDSLADDLRRRTA